MSEWPKTLWDHGEDDNGDYEWSTVPSSFKVDEVEVIPADLGRELYEAVRATRNWATKTDLAHAQRLCVDAAARYEREVGDE